MPQVPVLQILQGAILHHQAGRLDQAEGLYRQILARQPNHPDALHLLGTIFYARGHIPQAIVCYQQSLQLAPRAPRTLNSLGLALHRAGQLDQAAACFTDALRLDPAFADAHVVFSLVLARLANLRRTLRPRLEQSPLMDAPRFARDIEAAYRQMWGMHCAAHNSLPRS